MRTESFDNVKSERISIRLESDIKQRIERAAAIDHRSITSFIIASAVDSAEKILKRGDQMVLSDEDWDRFYNALTKPPKPNKALKKAFADYSRRNIRSDV